MASLSFTLFSSLLRQHSNGIFAPYINIVQPQDLGFRSKVFLTAASKKRITEALSQEASDNEVAASVEQRNQRTPKRTSARSRKKDSLKVSDSYLSSLNGDAPYEEPIATSSITEDSHKTKRTRKKATSASSSLGKEATEERVTRRRSKKKIVKLEDKESELELSDQERDASLVNLNDHNEEVIAKRGRRKKKTDNLQDQDIDIESSDLEKNTSFVIVQSDDEDAAINKAPRRRRSKKKVENLVEKVSDAENSDDESDSSFVDLGADDEEELEFDKDGTDDISFTYGWPPLVCCFGAAQHAFVPSGRRANRLIDHEMHERKKDAIWDPQKFVRSPGGCSSNVAVALASLGGKVAFMGKVGDDDYGQSLLAYLNFNNVQTRSIRIDSKRATAVSQMKIVKRGGLRMSSMKPCAEDSLSKSEINIDVLKEAKMFYFNTFSLLDQNMRSTMLQAVKISKKLGGVVFYDLNLPLPLWQSSEETKTFIQQALVLADIIEVTKQELEFLCGIQPSERFDTKDNDRSKFTHYIPDVIAPLWHENLKVLFVTNGTSKIHYYTRDHNGAILGMEDAPLTPYTCDMSASGDGFIAGIMRMLTVQPHLMTDKGYLERSIKYAISCGVTDQWFLARRYGYHPKEGMEDDVVPDPHGIKSVTERQYRTLVPVNL